MKYRKILIGFLVVTSILLSIKIIINYDHAANIKSEKENTIKELNKSFENAVKQEQRPETKTNSEKSVSVVKVSTSDNKKVTANVVGKIVINEINLDYPIIEGATQENLDISITRFYGSKINDVGNCILAGHNMRDGSLFGRLKELSTGDIITLYDNSGTKKDYRVFNIKVITPTDLSILSENTNNSRWVTLLTCTNHGKSRLIVEAKEV